MNSERKTQQDAFVQRILESFASIENRLRKNNITDPVQWDEELQSGMTKLGQEVGFSSCEKPGIFSDADWGEWRFEITWTKDEGPVKNNKENSRSTVSLMVHETRKSGDAITEGFRVPVQVFNGSKPGDSYTLIATYKDNDKEGEWLRYRVFRVDEANNSVWVDGGTMSHRGERVR